MTQHHRDRIESIARDMGAVLFGVARVEEVSDLTHEVDFSNLPTGLCFGYRLSDVVIDGIVDHPTRTYQYHYRQVNLLLDAIGLRIVSHIQELGHRAFPVPSSQVVDWDGFHGHISHKAVGRLAGLGWIGRNNLLVNRRYGARVRYATVLTDLVLPYDSPTDDDCGSCRECVATCPGAALGETREDYNLEKCVAAMDVVCKKVNIGTRICGICVKACRGNR